MSMTITMSGRVLPSTKSVRISSRYKIKPASQMSRLSRQKAAAQQEEVRDLDGDHRREYGTDQIKEVGDVIHRKKDGCQDADEGDHDANSLLFP